MSRQIRDIFRPTSLRGLNRSFIETVDARRAQIRRMIDGLPVVRNNYRVVDNNIRRHYQLLLTMLELYNDRHLSVAEECVDNAEHVTATQEDVQLCQAVVDFNFRSQAGSVYNNYKTEIYEVISYLNYKYKALTAVQRETHALTSSDLEFITLYEENEQHIIDFSNRTVVQYIFDRQPHLLFDTNRQVTLPQLRIAHNGERVTEYTSNGSRATSDFSVDNNNSII